MAEPHPIEVAVVAAPAIEPPGGEALLDPIDALLAEPAWVAETKEKLTPRDVLHGLLDQGLFGEKVPPCFVSTGLADASSFAMDQIMGLTEDKALSKQVNARARDYIRYEAIRDINIPRHMGIPHPESYGLQALAIAKHWELIAKHCNRPSPPVNRVHVRHAPKGGIFEMNYKGNERFKYEEEEIRWMSGAQYMVEADIASCFPSIYTHVIPWTLHKKEEVKKDHSLVKFAGNLLDKTTQNTRDRQTNGLLIGPHASNIISEIILTQIDLDLQQRGHSKFVRHVDDYKFYAATFEEAENFIKNLGLCLRRYELSLNEKKTQILPLPRPSDANWILVLNRFQFPKTSEVRFSTIRSYLDLALECAQASGKSSPLNYAIKTLAKKREQVEEHTDGQDNEQSQQSIKLNARAKRMYTQEAINLALAFPYLAPMLDEYVFERYWHEELLTQIRVFSSHLISLGMRKLYPDTIAQAVYLALKYDFAISSDEQALCEPVKLDDCIANVLLLEYAKKRNLATVVAAVKERAEALKTAEPRERDKQWLLIYQVWSVSDLKKYGQAFLSELKSKDFKFLSMPETAVEAVAPALLGALQSKNVI